MNKDERIDRLLDTLEVAQEGMDGTTFWPCHPAQIEAYFSHFFALDLLDKFKEDKRKFERGLKMVKIGVLRQLFYSFAIVGLKVANKFEGYKIPTRDIVDFTVCILDVVKNQTQGDEYCLDGKNLLLGKFEAEKIVEMSGWQKPENLEKKKILAHLTVGAEALVWSLFYDFLRQGGVEVHGPYETSKGMLLIRDFYDLDPPVWKTNNKYPQLKMHLLYQFPIDIKIDFANHLVYKKAILEKLKGFLVVSNNKVISIEEIKKIDEYYAKLREKQVKSVESLPPLEMVRKGVEIFYYLMKDFFDFYNQDWHPPEEVYNNIKKVGLKYWERYKPTKREGPSVFRKLYDPRIEWVR